MNTTSITIRSVLPIYGRARGHAGDVTSGDPRLVIDTPDGERIYATFAAGVNVSAEAHYRSFAHQVAQRMDAASRMDLAASLLSVLSAEQRTEVIERVIGDWHTPRVMVQEADADGVRTTDAFQQAAENADRTEAMAQAMERGRRAE